MVHVRYGFIAGLVFSAQASEVVQAWIYPGAPACTVAKEIADGRVINVLKPQYFNVTSAGKLQQLTAANAGCNGYSAANFKLTQQHSQQQYITVSAGAAEVAALVATSAKQQSAIQTLVAFVTQIGATGVELDFEGYSSWTAKTYTGYKQFLTSLGTALHAIGKTLMIDTPAIPNAALQKAYNPFKYEDINLLPVDYITVMCYDAMWDYGVGTAVTPTWWLTDCIEWVKARITDTSRIVIGLPSYGYHGVTGSYAPVEDVYSQTIAYSGFKAAQRDEESQEMFWHIGTTTYCYQDSVSLDYKKSVVAALGIEAVSVWSLGGGNQWFSH